MPGLLMSGQFSTIIYEKHGGVAHLSLNRPAQLNAFSVAMRDDFAEVLSAVAEDPDAECLLITGQGRAFCAGADLTEFGSAPSQVIARRVRWQRDVWGQLIDLRQPIVVAVHGYCIGSGVEIALLADVRIAAVDATFALPEVRLGMIPAAGGTQTGPASMGPSRALDLLLTGRQLGTEEALNLGLVSRVAQPDELIADAWEIAGQLAAQPAHLNSRLRRSLREGADLSLSAGLDMEQKLAAAAMGAGSH